MWAIIIFTLITLGAAGLMYLSTKVFAGGNTKQKFIDLSYAFIPLLCPSIWLRILSGS